MNDLRLSKAGRRTRLLVAAEWDIQDEVELTLENGDDDPAFWLTREEAGQLRDHLDQLLRTNGRPRRAP